MTEAMSEVTENLSQKQRVQSSSFEPSSLPQPDFEVFMLEIPMDF